MLALETLRNDVRQLRDWPSQPQRKTRTLLADKGYDHPGVHANYANAASPETSPGAEPVTKSPGPPGLRADPGVDAPSSVGSQPAGNAAPTSTRTSCHWRPRSSAGRRSRNEPVRSAERSRSPATATHQT